MHLKCEWNLMKLILFLKDKPKGFKLFIDSSQPAK